MIRPTRFALLLAIIPIAIFAYLVSLYPSAEQLRFGATKDGEIVACQQKGLVSVPGFYLLACLLGFFLPGLFAGTLQPPISFLDAIAFLLIPIIRPVSAMWMLFFLLVHLIVLSPERLRVGGRISVKREIDDDSRSRSELAIDT